MSFYNSTNETGKVLAESHNKARTQYNIIATYFNEYKQGSASEIWRLLFDYSITPLNSIRRAISDLKRAGVIVKTSKKVIGAYGKPEYVWQKL